MKNVLKRNQIIIFGIAIMLVTIGYMSYSMNVEQVAQTSAMEEVNQVAGIGDARLVSNNNVITDEEEASMDNSEAESNGNEEYFTQSKLDREKMYSEMLESYQSILANPDVSQEQKNNAQQEINKINGQRNSIMIAENLIRNKGFQNIIIFVNNQSVSAVVRADNIETAEIAQIQSIIQRELNISVENIHISNK
ncbi:MAG: SpoIIIAH-like family protein [Clostridia bacterium]|nr:SpoIIIAH-like family protein [Clostridia bacterium]